MQPQEINKLRVINNFFLQFRVNTESQVKCLRQNHHAFKIRQHKKYYYLYRGSIVQFVQFAPPRVGEPAVLSLLENLVHGYHHLHPSLALSGPAHIRDLVLLLLIAGQGHHKAFTLRTSVIRFDNLGKVDV